MATDLSQKASDNAQGFLPVFLRFDHFEPSTEPTRRIIATFTVQICFVCDLRQWRRGQCRGDYNTTSARLSVTKKKTHFCQEQFQHVETLAAAHSCKEDACRLSLKQN